MKPQPIWHVPLLVLAGMTALAGAALTLAFGAREPWPAVEWGLASASLTFTTGRIVHARSVTKRELELLVLASLVFVALYLTPFALTGVAFTLALIAAGEANPSKTQT